MYLNKELEDILAIIFKLITDILFSNIILFINNYFSKSKVAKALKVKRIIIYKTIKLN